MAKKKQYRIFHCNNCERDTRHSIEALEISTEVIRRSNEGFPGFSIDHELMIIKCAGCEDLSFASCAPMVDSCVQFPERVTDNLKGLVLADHELMDLPKGIAALYAEVMITLEHRAPVLTGIGIRALVEAICLNRKIEGYNLMLKIQELYKQGLITKRQQTVLDKLRGVGNAAAHRIKPMNDTTLYNAMHIINHMLRDMYVIPKSGKKIRL